MPPWCPHKAQVTPFHRSRLMLLLMITLSALSFYCVNRLLPRTLLVAGHLMSIESLSGVSMLMLCSGSSILPTGYGALYLWSCSTQQIFLADNRAEHADTQHGAAVDAVSERGVFAGAAGRPCHAPQHSLHAGLSQRHRP